MNTSVKQSEDYYRHVVHHPTRLQFGENTDVLDIAAGYGFSAFAVRRTDGETLFGTGMNTDGQLGLQQRPSGSTWDIVIYPTPINLPRKEGETPDDLEIKSMSAGRAHLVVVAKSGAVFTLGNNSYGQCVRRIFEEEAYKSSGIINRIDKLAGDDDVVESVECGQDHTLFLMRSGNVYSCGWGADGQTGLDNFDNTSEPQQVEGDIKGEKIVKVSSRADCVLAVNAAGEVFGWGNSEYGQLSESEDATTQISVPRHLKITKGLGKIVDVAAGGSVCMALNDEGDVFTWGYGILGFGPNVEQSSQPRQIPPPLFGRTDFHMDSKVVSISSGVFHMGAVNSEGDLFMWGKNRFGCLGLGHKKDQYFPFKTAVNAKIKKVACGVDHCLALCKPFM